MPTVLDQWEWQHPGSERMYTVSLLERPRPGDPDAKERRIRFETEGGEELSTATDLGSRDQATDELLEHLVGRAGEPGQDQGDPAPKNER